MTIGERIKYLRDKNSLTQTDVARRVGIATQTIFKYEKNIVTNIPMENIEKLARIFDVSPAYLMGWESEEDSIASDLQAAFKIQDLEKIRMQQAANTYTIHGSNGNGAVVITSNIPKDKYFLIGEGEASELTKSQYSALKGVLEVMSADWDDK